LRPVLEEYGVAFRVMHGYASATALWDAAKSSRRRPFTAFYVGDYDPSGLHMSQVDIPERLEQYHARIRVERIALAGQDIGELPSFDVETKKSDARHSWYVRNYGQACWELDAMNPNHLRARVAGAIEGRIDRGAWELAGLSEEAEADSIEMVFGNWNALLNGDDGGYSVAGPDIDYAVAAPTAEERELAGTLIEAINGNVEGFMDATNTQACEAIRALHELERVEANLYGMSLLWAAKNGFTTQHPSYAAYFGPDRGKCRLKINERVFRGKPSNTHPTTSVA
jgi:hypothetical protein